MRFHFLPAVALSFVSACTDVPSMNAMSEDGEHGVGKADSAGPDSVAVEVLSWLKPNAPVTAQLSTNTAHHGYVVYASEGAVMDLEVTQSGSSRNLDTVLNVYGPRTAAGGYPSLLASDNDSGYGALSKLKSVRFAQAGFYLVEVTTGSTMAASFSAKNYRLAATCQSGVCESTAPVSTGGYDLKWSLKAVEYVAAARQTYAAATRRLNELDAAGELTGDWAVVLDLDETTISNVEFQRQRAELGTGYSSTAWKQWTQRRAASAIPGAVEFLEEVQALGGAVFYVTNRKADECPDTMANLAALGLPSDPARALCRTDSSDKNPRFAQVQSTHDVVMFVGDNIQDFPGLTQDRAIADGPEFEQWATRFFIVPNPMYGSWEKLP